MTRRLSAACVAFALVTSVRPAQAQEPVDLLLHSAKIFTANERLSTFSAVAVRDGRIVALGWDALREQYRAQRSVDLGGKLVVPGFIDTHIHISGDPERWVDLSGLETMSELKARVTRKAEQLGSGEWITGYGHNILIAQQPNFTYTLDGRYAEHLDGERYQTNNPLRSPMSHGVFVALGSDILPIGPMVGLYGAVTRKGMSGAVVGPGEALTMPEAIVGYTRLAAHLTFEEDEKGSLEVGKLADMVVLSQDLLTIDPDRTLETEVEMTILGGNVVYER